MMLLYDNTFVRDYNKGRVILFNRYAVKATKARVYYAMGKYTEAAKYAREVINATQNFEYKYFTLTLDAFPASKEMIFGVYAADRSTAIRTAFLRPLQVTDLSVEGRRDTRSLYETDPLQHLALTSVSPLSLERTRQVLLLLQLYPSNPE